MLHLKELQEDCRPLQQAYADVEQESPRTEAKGYIKATFLEPDEEHDYTELTIIYFRRRSTEDSWLQFKTKRYHHPRSQE